MQFPITFDICKCDMSMLTLEFSIIQDGRIAWREVASAFTEGHKRGLGSKSAVDVHPEEAKNGEGFPLKDRPINCNNIHNTLTH